MIAKAAPLDIKDPIWRYLWVKENEPENYSRVYKWIDVKDYLNARCTGNIVATEDSAFGTMIYENAKGKKNFSSRLLKMFGVQEPHMPKVIPSTDVVGYLSPKAAEEMGLAAGTPVFGGGGDSSCIPLGSGYTGTGDTHVYIGTSGWVSTVSEKRPTDPISMIASIYGSEEGKFNYHAEMNAAGKCYEWVRDHVALDSINIYADGPGGSCSCRDIKIYDRLSQAAMQAEVGSGGLIFTPWLTGERCPISSPEPCGMFFNLSLRTDKSAIIRSVLEGICYHINWMMEMHEKILLTSPTLRFVGGGSLSPVTCQMLADITGKQGETIPWPQNAGAVGAAVISAVGLGIIPDFSSVKDYIPVDRVYIPDPKAHELYSGYFRIYKKLYPANRKLFEKLHKIRGCDHERL